MRPLVHTLARLRFANCTRTPSSPVRRAHGDWVRWRSSHFLSKLERNEDERENMTKEQHRKLHKRFHTHLEKLITDWMACGAPEAPRLPSLHTILELSEWSHRQTLDPEEPKR